MYCPDQVSGCGTVACATCSWVSHRCRVLLQVLDANKCTEAVEGSSYNQHIECGKEKGRQLGCAQHQNVLVTRRNSVPGSKRKGRWPRTRCSPVKTKKEDSLDPCAPTPSKRDALLSRFYSEHRQSKGHRKRSWHDQPDRARTEKRMPAADLNQGHELTSSSGSPGLSTIEVATQHTREPANCPPDAARCPVHKGNSGPEDCPQWCLGASKRAVSGSNLGCMHSLVTGWMSE